MSKQVAIVTGAGGDIGRAISIELAKDGHAVLCLDIATGPNEETAELVAQSGGEAVALDCNILDQDQLSEMLAEARKLGAPKILVNNVGAITAASTQESTIDNWQRDFDLNIKGAVGCFKTLGRRF